LLASPADDRFEKAVLSGPIVHEGHAARSRGVLVEHSVTMKRFPDGLQFPADLAGKIRYDPEKERLVYSGFMSKADFDRLSRLSDDWSYRRPLEELFRLCMPEERRPVLARLFSAFSI
jgi:hypothetical protein